MFEQDYNRRLGTYPISRYIVPKDNGPPSWDIFLTSELVFLIHSFPNMKG